MFGDGYDAECKNNRLHRDCCTELTCFCKLRSVNPQHHRYMYCICIREVQYCLTRIVLVYQRLMCNSFVWFISSV